MPADKTFTYTFAIKNSAGGTFTVGSLTGQTTASVDALAEGMLEELYNSFFVNANVITHDDTNYGGDSVTITAVADNGYTFSHWENAGGTVLTNTYDDVTDRTIYAVFTQTKYVNDNSISRLVYNIKQRFQPKLESGINIKTINNTSILGSGNITISGGGSYTATAPIDITNDVISGTFDNTPTASSSNFISSGAVKSYVDSAISTAIGNIDTLLTNLNSGGGV